MFTETAGAPSETEVLWEGIFWDVRRVKLDGQKVVQQEQLLRELNMHFRNVRTGPDGFLYLSTDDGKLARLVPQKYPR